MDPELASFVLKFQDICKTGKNATLSFSTLSRKVFANLSVEIGSVKSHPQAPVPCAKSSPNFNASNLSPSRKRRLQRRAESRRLFAEEAKQDLSVDELKVLEAAEKAVNVRVQNMEVEEPLAVRDDASVLHTEDDTINQRKNCENNSNMGTSISQEIVDSDCGNIEEMDEDKLKKDKMAKK